MPGVVCVAGSHSVVVADLRPPRYYRSVCHFLLYVFGCLPDTGCSWMVSSSCPTFCKKKICLPGFQSLAIWVCPVFRRWNVDEAWGLEWAKCLLAITVEPSCAYIVWDVKFHPVTWSISPQNGNFTVDFHQIWYWFLLSLSEITLMNSAFIQQTSISCSHVS